MKHEYLSWYKNYLETMDLKTHRSLLSSSISEPLDCISQLFDGSWKDMIRKGLNTPNPRGLPDLKNVIRDYYGIVDSSLALTQGATNAIYLLCRTILNSDDEVIVECPGYQPLMLVPKMTGATVLGIQRKPPLYKLDIKDLQSKISLKTRLIIITNLHNPSGVYLTEPEIIEIYQAIQAVSDRVYLLVDEIYKDFVPGNNQPASELGNRVLSICSLTKVYGLDYLRCGWLSGSGEVVNRIMALQTYTDGIGSRYLETLSCLLMPNLDLLRKYAIDHVRVNRDYLVRKMKSLIDAGIIRGEVPEHGCTYFPELTVCGNTWKICDFLKSQHQVYVVPGVFFESDAHIRVGFGGDSALVQEGIDRLVRGLLSL